MGFLYEQNVGQYFVRNAEAIFDAGLRFSPAMSAQVSDLIQILSIEFFVNLVRNLVFLFLFLHPTRQISA